MRKVINWISGRAEGAGYPLWVAVLIVCTTSITVFGRTVFYDFTNFDDGIYVYENPRVLQGLTVDNVAWAFSAPRLGHYHPLTWLSLMTDAALWGPGPGGFHAGSVAAQIAASLAMLLLFRRLGFSVAAALFATLLLSLHPLRVESAAWISSRKELLAAFFGALALWTHAAHGARPSAGRHAATLLFFILALLSKSSAMVLPGIMLLLDVYPLHRLRWHEPGRMTRALRLLLEKAPFAVLSLGAAALAVYAAQQYDAVRDVSQYDWPTRLSNVVVNYAVYARSFAVPLWLAPQYPHPPGGHGLPAVAASALFLAALTAACWLLRRRFPWLLLGWLWFLGALLPAVGFLPVGGHIRADRYMMVPAMGLALAVTGTLTTLLRAHPSWNRRALLAAVALLHVLGVLTVLQTRHWRDSEALWTHTLAVTRNNEKAHYNLGNVYLRRGEWDQAMAQYQAVLAHTPGDSDALTNMGIAALRKGEQTGAVDFFQRALGIAPGDARTHFHLGEALLAQGKAGAAAQAFAAARGIQPRNGSYAMNQGIALAMAGRFAEAAAALREAAQLAPGDASAWFNLGNALLELAAYEEAARAFEQSASINPDDPEAWIGLGMARSGMNQQEAARHAFGQALRIEPGSGLAREGIQSLE